MTDANIAAFQEAGGLTMPTGRERNALLELQQLAFELIKICELEISGIRDGDSKWHGSDPVGGTVQEIERTFNDAFRPHARTQRFGFDTASRETTVADGMPF